MRIIEKRRAYLSATPAQTKGDDLVERLKKWTGIPACLEAATRIQSLTASNEALERERANPWCPDVCPITGRRFFMWIDGEPTYGGPFDSYTIPTRDEDGEFSCRRFDHDEGGWKDWDEGLSLKLIDEGELINSETALQAAQAEIARMRELAERAFKDGAHYATIVEVANTDEARDEAWQMSTARTALTPQEPT